MAAATYTTDLTTLSTLDSAKTNSEFTGYTKTAKPSSPDSDFPIQGTGHISAEQRQTGKGSIAVDNGSNISWTSGWNFFLWGVFLAAAAVDTDANGGVVMIVGSSTSAFNLWNVGGSDFGRYPYGGWQNFVVNPEVTPTSTTGSPGTNYRWVGMGCNVISAISKGSPYGVDAIRYGRGDIRVANGDSANGYATFLGIASQNDNTSNKWGLFQEQNGSYIWKGLMTLGYSTAVDFRDSNRVIAIDNTRSVSSSFNKIEIRQTGSNVEWDTIFISALGTTSRGAFECIDNATVEIKNSSFTDMDTFIFKSNSSLSNTTFRRCNQITQGGATFDGCLFSKSNASISLLLDDINEVSGCYFTSDGTGHAIQGFPTAGSYTLDNLTFTDYASSNGSTGNEAIYVTASSGIVNLYLTGGTSPSIRTAGATVNVIQSATLTIGGVRSASDIFIYKTSDMSLLSSADPVSVTDGSPVDGVQYYKLIYSYNAATLSGVDVQIKVFNLSYQNERIKYTLTSSDARIGVQQRIDRNYKNPS